MKNKTNPWKKLSSKVVYKNLWFTVREDQVEKPGNRKGIYGVVETPPSVFIVAINNENEIYLVGLYRYPTGKYSLEIPAGSTDNEDELQSAKKELLEETGLRAKTWTKIGKFHPWNGVSSETSIVFVAQDLEETNKKLDPDEGIIEVRKVSLPEAFDLIKSGEIEDGQAIAALTLAKLFLENK